MDLDYATAAELTRAMRDRALSSRELLDHILDRVDRYNPDLNAIVALDADRSRVTALGAADAATAKGDLSRCPSCPPNDGEGRVGDRGPRHHLRCSRAGGYHVPRVDALAVGRLKAAGAIIFGKTNTPLYAGDFQTFNDVYGVTNNPWDTSRTLWGGRRAAQRPRSPPG